MTSARTSWTLQHRGDLVATLAITETDFLWVRARVDAEARFEQFRPLFRQELTLLEDLDENLAAWEQLQRRIREALVLVDPAGVAVSEYLLHVDGHEAWWRWSHQPESG